MPTPKPVKKWSHCLYYGSGALIPADKRINDTKKGVIRIRFPTTKHANDFVANLKVADTEGLLFLPERKDGVSIFKPKTETPDPANYPVKFMGIPEYAMAPDDWALIMVVFNTEQNEEKFWSIISSTEGSGIDYIPEKTIKSFWLPHKAIEASGDQKWLSTAPIEEVLPKYPIYVLSKGRYERRLTADALNEMGCPFYLLIEECEEKLYKETEKYETNYLVMPPELNNLGQGSITARNFAWQHSMENGHEKHWVLDDNMDGFYRFYHNKRIRCKSPICLRQCEIQTDYYDNVYLSGLQYKSFVPEVCQNKPNVILNTRIYSCILIRNDLDKDLKTERWRGKYNEDTDLSIRVLKSGGANMLFQNFLADKQTTKSCKGGNTDSIYKGDGIQKKLDSLIEQHPECVKATFKFGKNHHHVDYSAWAENPLNKDGTNTAWVGAGVKEINEFGLYLTEPTGASYHKKPAKKKVLAVKEEVEEHTEPAEGGGGDSESDIVENLFNQVPIEEIEDFQGELEERDLIIKEQAYKIKRLEALLACYLNQ